MLFWLLVYVTVLLSWFPSSKFQSGWYEDTNKGAHQTNRPTAIWAPKLNRSHCYTEDSHILTSNMAQEIQELKIPKWSKRQGYQRQAPHALSHRYFQGLHCSVFDRQSSRPFQERPCLLLSPLVWRHLTSFVFRIIRTTETFYLKIKCSKHLKEA